VLRRRDKDLAPASLWRKFQETMAAAIAAIAARVFGDVQRAAEAEGIVMTPQQRATVAAAWTVYADGYTTALAAELERTTREGLAAIEEAYKAGTIDLAEAEARAAKLFAPERAQSIAITETTRLFNDVSQIVYQVTGVVDRVEFLTVRDPWVDAECAELEGQIFPVDEAPQPPIHVNCRCRLAPVVREEAA
jgi:SPP1 gp7 family putative phage head morphogenesis protein